MSRLDQLVNQLENSHDQKKTNYSVSTDMIQATSKCPLCGGTYWIISESGDARRCKCFEQEKIRRRLQFANIPESYKDVCLDNFDISLYHLNESHETIVKVKDITQIYLEEFEESHLNGKGLYLWSHEKGSGKTRMAASIANELIKNYQVKLATSMAIINEIRATWNKDSDSTESQLIHDLVNTDILVIDDFGTETAKDWINEKFYYIINERYINRNVTIYTSNYDINSLPYDHRIVDRVRETAYQVHFPEESIRSTIEKVNKIFINRKVEEHKKSHCKSCNSTIAK